MKWRKYNEVPQQRNDVKIKVQKKIRRSTMVDRIFFLSQHEWRLQFQHLFSKFSLFCSSKIFWVANENSSSSVDWLFVNAFVCCAAHVHIDFIIVITLALSKNKKNKTYWFCRRVSGDEIHKPKPVMIHIKTFFWSRRKYYYCFSFEMHIEIFT